MTDNRGTNITSVALVVYNISGQLALGKVLDVYESWQRQRIKIELGHKAAGCLPGHISTVRNERSVLRPDRRLADGATMTPAERLALLVLLDEYQHPQRSECGYGPYGRAEARTGLAASRIAQIEYDLLGDSYPNVPLERLCDLLHTRPWSHLLERTI